MYLRSSQDQKVGTEAVVAETSSSTTVQANILGSDSNGTVEAPVEEAANTVPRDPPHRDHRDQIVAIMSII